MSFSSKLCVAVVLAYSLIAGCFLYLDTHSDLDGISGYSFPVHGSDSPGYVHLANTIFNSQVFSESEEEPFVPDTFRTPGYPAFVLVFSKILGGDLLFVIFAQILLAVLTALLIIRIGEHLGSRQFGICAAILFLLDPTVIFSTLTIMSETVFTFLLVLGVYLSFFSERVPRSWYAPILAGLVLGGATLVRPVGMVVPGLIVLGKILIDRKVGAKKLVIWSGLFVITALAVVFPWLWRNKQISGAYGLTSLSAYNLAFSEVPNFISYKTGVSREEAIAVMDTEIGPLSEEQKMSLEYSAQITGPALQIIKEDLGGYLTFHAVSGVPFFLGSSLRTAVNNLALPELHETFGLLENPPHILKSLSQGDFSAVVRVLTTQGIFTLERIVWALLFIGALFSWGSRMDKKVVLFFLALILTMAFLMGPIFTPRYRMPTEPFFFLLAVAGLSRVRPFSSMKS